MSTRYGFGKQIALAFDQAIERGAIVLVGSAKRKTGAIWRPD